MNAERWKRVEELFHAALEKGEAERSNFLREACAGDSSLRDEVESLLSLETESRDFIEAPAIEVTARMLAEAGTPSIPGGHLIEHYKVIELIGAGGMGEVYLAEDTRLRRKVALKILPEHLVQAKEHMRRFEQEARTVASLSHPNVCAIHEVVSDERGRHCIVMEYVDGLTLRQRVSRDPLPVSEALHIAEQVASALASAHAMGIIHRDIKPENVILRQDGYVKVLDFGLAKLVESRPDRPGVDGERRITDLNTLPGTVMGTVAYMSPEQARGLPVDSRTDIWSLGVLLYEMVSGHQPFEGATHTDIVISIIQQDPVPLSGELPEPIARLWTIVRRALAKDPDKRYPKVDDLLSDLRRLSREIAVRSELGRRDEYRGTIPTVRLSGTQPTGAAEISRAGWIKRRTTLLGAIVGVMMIAAALPVPYFRTGHWFASRTEIRSLAVLPLSDLSGDSSQEYFVDGMTEALITDLSKIRALRVISRPSVMTYKGSTKPLQQIGRELNVDAVLTGSAIRSGERVRTTLQLINAVTGENLWTESYERDFRDVLDLQRGITRGVVSEIRVKLTPGEQLQIGAAGPVNPEAYDQYLLGKFHLHRQNRENNEAAIAALERAVAADPAFAAAHAELAQAYVWGLFLFRPDDRQLAEKAFMATEKALALDPNLSVAYLARGRLLWTPANRFPHERVIREYRRALELDPALDEARNQLALVYNHIGSFEKAMHELESAVATNPTNSLAQFRIAETQLFKGSYEQALAGLRSVPSEVNPALVGHQIAWALFNLGRRDEASAVLDKFLKDYPEDNRGLYTSLQAVLAASSGQKRMAEERIDLAIKKGKGFGHFHHTAFHVACAYALMGENDKALEWLAAAAEDGFPCYPLFEYDPGLAGLRRDPRFQKFVSDLRQRWGNYAASS